jgi:hypothetical protein
MVAGAGWTYKLFTDSPAAYWWISQIEFAMAVIIPTALAVLFLNSLTRLVVDALIATWKGFSGDKVQLILA